MSKLRMNADDKLVAEDVMRRWCIKHARNHESDPAIAAVELEILDWMRTGIRDPDALFLIVETLQP